MKTRFHAAAIILPLVVLVGVSRLLAAQTPVVSAAISHPVLNTDQIVDRMVQRNIERAQALGAFQGTRIYRLEYRGLPSSRSAEMVVDVKYQAPSTKEFTIRSSTGSKLLIDRVFKKLLEGENESLRPEVQGRVALNRENYNFTLMGQENIAGVSFYVLSVEPLTSNKLLYRGRIWVDATDFAVTRIEAAPAKNPSFWIRDTTIEHTYMKVGAFWLPATNRSTSNTRLGGHALLTIDYKDYQVTTATSVASRAATNQR